MAFEVLGDVVAKVSGVTFDDYIAAHILQPLVMTSSTLLLARADTALLAAGYTRSRTDSAMVVPVAAYPFNRMHGPSSNLFSNVVDMSRWAMANFNQGELDGKRILDRASYQVLWKPAVEVEYCRRPSRTECRKPGSSVGLSWFLEQKNGHLIVSHGGGDDGFLTVIWLIPDLKFAVVMMTNFDRAGPLLRRIQSEALALAGL
jgi:CubicO group peptidase (beta-lactamase class C family)